MKALQRRSSQALLLSSFASAGDEGADGVAIGGDNLDDGSLPGGRLQKIDDALRYTADARVMKRAPWALSCITGYITAAGMIAFSGSGVSLLISDRILSRSATKPVAIRAEIVVLFSITCWARARF